MYRGKGVHMSIQELIDAAKATKVTSEHVDVLRAQLKKSENEQGTKSLATTKAFLARTYSL